MAESLVSLTDHFERRQVIERQLLESVGYINFDADSQAEIIRRIADWTFPPDRRKADQLLQKLVHRVEVNQVVEACANDDYLDINREKGCRPKVTAARPDPFHVGPPSCRRVFLPCSLHPGNSIPIPDRGFVISWRAEMQYGIIVAFPSLADVTVDPTYQAERSLLAQHLLAALGISFIHL